jgi:hypothetical protein
MLKERHSQTKVPEEVGAKTPRKKNDIIFKGAFEEYFVHLLRFTYPDADQIFDFDKEIIFMNNELAEINIDPGLAGGTTRADLLAKVFRKDGTEQCFYLHIEIQAETNAAFSERVLGYYIRLRDKYGPSVVSLAVYTGKKSQLRPDMYQSSILGTELSFKFHTYQIFDHTEEELLAMNNPFALAVIVAQQEALCEKLNDSDRQSTRMKIIDAMKASGKFNAVQITEFVRFLSKIIIIENKEYNDIFDQHLQNLTGGTVTMGLKETLDMLEREEGIEIGIQKGIQTGIKKGEAEKSHEVVENLITKLGLSNEQTADVANVSLSFVKKVRKELESKK